jgi:hypothetical protein
MPKTLSKTNIAVNETIFAANVTQSIDAFTATEAYNIDVSGSLSVIGAVSITGVGATGFKLINLPDGNFTNVLVNQPSTGYTYVTGSAGLNVGNVTLTRNETTPSGVVGQLMASGSTAACKLYFHNGTEFKEIAFV